jgi:hypothetical protein
MPAKPPAGKPAPKAAAPPRNKSAPPRNPAVVSPDDELGDLYALADDEAKAAKTPLDSDNGGKHCPSCGAALAATAVLCTNCGYNLKTGARLMTAGAAPVPAAAIAAPAMPVAAGPASPMLGYVPRPQSHVQDVEDHRSEDLFREFILPSALCLLGVLMLMVQHMYGDYSVQSLVLALPRVGASLLFNLVLSFAGMLMVARLFEIGFGAPGPAVLKAAACCVMPPALANMVGGFVGSDSFFVQIMITSLVMFPLTWGAFMYLFYLDFDEAVYLDIIIWLVNQWLVIFLLGAIFGSIGVGGMGLATAGGQAVTTVDQDAMTLLASPQAKGDPIVWLYENDNRILGQMFREDSVKLAAETLKLAGAGKVTVIGRGDIGDTLVMRLPDDEEKRAKIFQWEADRAALHGYDAAEDDGQKYLIVEPYFLDPSAPRPTSAAPVQGGDANDDAADDDDDLVQ